MTDPKKMPDKAAASSSAFTAQRIETEKSREQVYKTVTAVLATSIPALEKGIELSITRYENQIESEKKDNDLRRDLVRMAMDMAKTDDGLDKAEFLVKVAASLK